MVSIGIQLKGFTTTKGGMGPGLPFEFKGWLGEFRVTNIHLLTGEYLTDSHLGTSEGRRQIKFRRLCDRHGRYLSLRDL